MSGRAAIFAGGDLSIPARASPVVRPDDLVIAVNGGLRHVLNLGLVPTCVIGDLDSIAGELVQLARGRGAEVIRYRPDKDKTDLELAVELARERSVSGIRIYAAGGGRLDHTLANVLLLTKPALEELDIWIIDAHNDVTVVRRSALLNGHPGELVSLIALTDRATGVTTSGLEYPLTEGVIERGSTLGISNVMTNDRASIVIGSGMLVLIHTPSPGNSAAP